MAAAVGPLGPTSQRSFVPGWCGPNSLRALRALRSNRVPQIRSTKRAARAQPRTKLLGAADIPPPRHHLPLRVTVGACVHTRQSAQATAPPSWQSTSVSAKVRGARRRWGRVRSRGAQGFWPARAARFVQLTCGAMSERSARRARRELRRPARNPSTEGTPAQQGPAPAPAAAAPRAPSPARNDRPGVTPCAAPPCAASRARRTARRTRRSACATARSAPAGATPRATRAP